MHCYAYCVPFPRRAGRGQHPENLEANVDITPMALFGFSSFPQKSP
jgi:hypothetical protein